MCFDFAVMLYIPIGKLQFCYLPWVVVQASHYFHDSWTWYFDAFKLRGAWIWYLMLSAEGSSAENAVPEMDREIPAVGCCTGPVPCHSCCCGARLGDPPHCTKGKVELTKILLKVVKFWWGWTSLGGEIQLRRPIISLKFFKKSLWSGFLALLPPHNKQAWWSMCNGSVFCGMWIAKSTSLQTFLTTMDLDFWLNLGSASGPCLLSSCMVCGTVQMLTSSAPAPWLSQERILNQKFQKQIIASRDLVWNISSQWLEHGRSKNLL